MRAVAAYMASRNNQGSNDRNGRETNGYERSMAYGGDMTYDRRSEYGGAESRQYSGEHGRQPNQYTRTNMEGPEMRRRRDSKGRYMEGGMTAGDREYDRNDAANHIPYRPDYPIEDPQNGLYDGGGMGFGTRDREYEMRSHYGRDEVQPQSAQVGGTLWMKPNSNKSDGVMLDKKSMEKWVHHMEDDKGKPIKTWNAEEIKPLAIRYGYPASGEEFDNFYTAIHMMKSDYCAVAEDFDVNTPAFYAGLADAWLKDPDADLKGREKLEAHYKYIVKGKK